MIKERLWEVDFLRGLAVILMIFFNYSYALKYLKIFTVSSDELFYWYIFPRFIGGMFIFIAGLSLTLSYSQNKRKFFTRGLKIFFYGILITVITYLTFPEAFVVFGILHFIGFSIIFGHFFLKFRKLNLILGILILVLGLYLQSFSFDFSWLLWLGFIPRSFYTFDYFPVLPWFGVTLLGIYFGKLLYKNGKRNFKIKDLSNLFFIKFLDFLGRNSLIIYLLHQPVLVLVLLAMGFKIL